MVLERVKCLDMGEWKTCCSVGDVLCEAVVPVGAKKIIGATEVSLDFLLANDPHLSKCRRERQHSFPHEKSFRILISDSVYTRCPLSLRIFFYTFLAPLRYCCTWKVLKAQLCSAGMVCILSNPCAVPWSRKELT